MQTASHALARILLRIFAQDRALNGVFRSPTAPDLPRLIVRQSQGINQLSHLGAALRRKYLDEEALLDPEHPDMTKHVQVYPAAAGWLHIPAQKCA